MSKRNWLQLTLVLTVVCGWSSSARAQFGGGNNSQANSPTISPYVNLLRRGNVGLNYYGIVRPQQNFAIQNQQLGQGILNMQMQAPQMQINSGSNNYSQLGMTGHPVIFNSIGNSQFSGGYLGSGGSGGVSSGVGGVSGHMPQFGGIGNTYRTGR